MGTSNKFQKEFTWNFQFPQHYQHYCLRYIWAALRSIDVPRLEALSYLTVLTYTTMDFNIFPIKQVL